MAAALEFRLQIGGIMVVGLKDMGHAIDNVDPMCRELFELARIVCHQTHLGHTESLQNDCRRPINPLIIVEAELSIGIDGIEAVVL